MARALSFAPLPLFPSAPLLVDLGRPEFAIRNSQWEEGWAATMSKIIPFRPPRPPRRNGLGGRGESSIFNLQSSIGTSGYNGPKVSTQVANDGPGGQPFLVGEWLVEPSLNRLSRGEHSRSSSSSRAMDVLLCLAERAADLVPKDVLLDTVWQTEFVARQHGPSAGFPTFGDAFGDDAQNPRYIETIRKRGYRLIAEVRPRGRTIQGVGHPFPKGLQHRTRSETPTPGWRPSPRPTQTASSAARPSAAALWRKITARRLLAVIGPSGVGKSSLLRAGVAARAPPGWRVVVFTPGESPTLSLARALAADHAGDPAAMARLLGFNDADTALAVVSRWRGQFEEAVLVVDQFEELFTLNPHDAQASFSELLRRLVEAADVHVVLAMRDDYLYRCQEFTAIAPIFEALTPLPPPTAEGLRRALKEPAAQQLYRFESELLVDRMMAEVEDERGALPLMAFAVHLLWEERDHEQRLLTEEAYERIGAVAGALAKHADATLERIGPKRLPIVRELFRNLVTAEGTRAVREVDELLSLFREGCRGPERGIGTKRCCRHAHRCPAG